MLLDILQWLLEKVTFVCLVLEVVVVLEKKLLLVHLENIHLLEIILAMIVVRAIIAPMEFQIKFHVPLELIVMQQNFKFVKYAR